MPRGVWVRFPSPALKSRDSNHESLLLFLADAKKRAGEGNLRFLNPSQLTLTSPIRGMPSSTTFQTGVPAAAMFSEHLADADDAALMRLRFAQNNFPFMLGGLVNVCTFVPAYTETLLHTFIRCLSPK